MSLHVAPINESKSLTCLLDGILPVEQISEAEISGLCLDSRAVKPRDCFIALQGEHSHGLRFLEQALDAGANAILTDAEGVIENDQVSVSVPIVVVENLRKYLGEISNRFFDYPSREMTIIGVTGTNGKTSIAALLAGVLKQHFGAAAYVGTLGTGCWPDLKEQTNTTPDLLSLQHQFATWHAQGVQACALEASSHALAQGRLQGVDIDVAIFSNLSHEHLDYHGSMQAYGESKRLLFNKPVRDAVINIDDAFGRDIYARIDPDIRLWPYGVTALNQSYPNLTSASSINTSLDGIEMWVSAPCGEGRISSPLVGEFNVANLLATIAGLAALGLEFDEIVSGIAKTPAIPGRMQVVNRELPDHAAALPAVIVDYAHTPDGLRHSLATLRKMVTGRVICIFGCGGERDREKRPMMGRIAEQLADTVIITSDNPRGEPQDEIIAQILAGQAAPNDSIIEPDRRQAIAQGIDMATVCDAVLIAGKGHEDYQLVGDEASPFSDLAVSLENLAHVSNGTQA